MHPSMKTKSYRSHTTYFILCVFLYMSSLWTFLYLKLFLKFWVFYKWEFSFIILKKKKCPEIFSSWVLMPLKTRKIIYFSFFVYLSQLSDAAGGLPYRGHTTHFIMCVVVVCLLSWTFLCLKLF